MKKISIYIYIVLFLSLFSCKKEEELESFIIAENLSQFNEIVLKSVFDVYLTQDSVFSIKIEGAEDVIKEVDYKIEDSVLYISNSFKQKWLHPNRNKVKLYIHSDKLRKVENTETCYFETTNPIITNEFGLIMGSKLTIAKLELNCNVFYFWNNHPCGGKLTLYGQTNTLKLWNFAIMSVDAKSLTAKNAIVENHSKGDCEVAVTDKLEYLLDGVGNIYLYGTPTEIVFNGKTSSGELIQVK